MSRKKVHNHYQDYIAAIMQARNVTIEEAKRIYEEETELDPNKVKDLTK